MNQLRVLSWPGADHRQNTMSYSSSVILRICCHSYHVHQWFIPCCHGNVLSEAPPSRWSYCGFQVPCHIAPSLSLFALNSLSMYHRSFFSKGSVCEVFLWLSPSCSDCSPSITTTPTLRELIPSDSPIRFQSVQVYKLSNFLWPFLFQRWGQNYPEWLVLPHLRLNLC
jgi:hypothetical protein